MNTTSSTIDARTESGIDAGPSIDLCTPAQACAALRLDEAAVVGLINKGELAAYNLAGSIRFKVADIKTVGAALTAA